jgi:hypothetical protein
MISHVWILVYSTKGVIVRAHLGPLYSLLQMRIAMCVRLADKSSKNTGWLPQKLRVNFWEHLVTTLISTSTSKRNIV